MKKKILSIAFGFLMIAVGSTTYAFDTAPAKGAKLSANEKVINNFNKQFKSSGNIFINQANNGFIVQSDVETGKVTAAYNKKGNWVYTIKYFNNAALEKNIMSIVNDSYHDYHITQMERVDQPGNQSVYIVYIQNHSSFKTVRVSNGQLELTQNFQKSAPVNM